MTRKLTDAQFRLLTVLADAASQGIAPGEAAFRAGYRGKGRSGAGRAPQWTGRVIMNMPERIRPKWSTGRVFITPAGLVALTSRGRQGA